MLCYIKRSDTGCSALHQITAKFNSHPCNWTYRKHNKTYIKALCFMWNLKHLVEV